MDEIVGTVPSAAVNDGLPGSPPDPGLNGFAVASLVCGIAGLGACFGLVFGAIAVAQISRRGGRGRGLAIAGLSLSALWGLVLTVVLAANALDLGSGDAGPAAAQPPAGIMISPPPIEPAKMAAGDCISQLEDDVPIHKMRKVPCHEPHHAEVYLVFDLKLWPYPGDAKLDAVAENRCRREFPGYGMGQFANGEMTYEFAAESAYPEDRWATCVAYAATGTWTGELPD